MIVVISDLHLVDETTGTKNVSAGAYKLWMEDVLDTALALGAKELELVYLGDIVDLLRTTQWFHEKRADRPWGDAEINDHPTKLGDACVARALKILEKIEARAYEQLRWLRGEWSGRAASRAKRLADRGVPIRRTFVHGNHDRLYCASPLVKARIDGMLGLDAAAPILHRVERPAYGLLGRHGHELDHWNFEDHRASPFADDPDFAFADYAKVPIGDVMTTELVARLPLAVKHAIENAGYDPALAREVRERLARIDDVRPLSATMDWVRHVAHAGEPWPKEIADIIDDTIAFVFEKFDRLPFVKRWKREHPLRDKLTLWATGLLARRGLSGLAIANRVGEGDDAPYREGAAREPRLLERGGATNYVVYGHTHEFAQVALRSDGAQEKLYLNSGTWRPRFHGTLDQRSFVAWKDITYLVFFRDDEDGFKKASPKGTSFRTWTGTMMKRRRG